MERDWVETKGRFGFCKFKKIMNLKNKIFNVSKSTDQLHNYENFIRSEN